MRHRRAVDFFFELAPEQRPWIAALDADGNGLVQVGLARTQMEHLRLPAATSWHWLEAYGRLDADPQVVHPEDWNAARAGVGAVSDRCYQQLN
ncbi:MAG: hypothetical protein QOH50_137 [Kribbellaceae bacterium]|jgi:hypothetical protein|nr:hypothetical protein [Kribbellaceae bacterium]